MNTEKQMERDTKDIDSEIKKLALVVVFLSLFVFTLFSIAPYL